MPRPMTRPFRLLTAAAALALTACGPAADRLGQIGRAPDLTPITDPAAQPDYRPVAMPMPAPPVGAQNVNSLWSSGSRAFFKDQRASDIGDILTVLIEINDRAQLRNATNRSRNSAENLGVSGFFGLEQPSQLGDILADGADPEGLVGTTGQSATAGSGNINRNEVIELKIAALITQVLPNGNLVIHGRQEVRVNNEVRELLVSGIIRPEDISSANQISYEKIAEARISYGGRGQITDVQQPRYGQQVLDVILPW